MISSVSGSSNLQTSILNKSNIKKDIQQDVSTANTSKVSNIKNAIENGTYELDMKKTAKAIVDTLV